MKEIIINKWIKFYAIGAMSKTQANDEGKGWRERLEIELNKRRDKYGNPIYLFNPCNEEQDKVKLNPKEYHKKLKGWIKTGKKDLVAKGSDLIWNGKQYIVLNEENKPIIKVVPGDNFYVENSNALICRIDPNDSPCGTFYEAGYAMKLNIPIYVIQTMSRENYPESFLGWVFGSNGKFFKNQSQLLTFLDKKYNFKLTGE